MLAFVEDEAKALAALGRLSDVTRVIDRSLSIGPRAGWDQFTPGRLMEHTARQLRAHGHLNESRVVAARAVEWYRGRPDNRDAPPGRGVTFGHVRRGQPVHPWSMLVIRIR